MGKPIQLDMFNDHFDMLMLQVQRLELQQSKLRRSAFARISELENTINELKESQAKESVALLHGKEKAIA